MIQITPIDANSQLIELDLGETTYQVGLDWNQEGQFWTLSVLNLDSAVLISGVPVRASSLLLRQVRSPSLPPGDFVPLVSQGYRIGRRDFATGRAALWYLEPEEVADVRAQFPGL